MQQLRLHRHVKIVSTIGPASNTSEVLRNMLEAGLDIARFNMNYGTLEEHSKLISEIRSLSAEMGLTTGILLDLPGSKRFSGDTGALFGKHLEFAVSQEADFIALSFLSSSRQIVEVKKMLEEMKSSIPIIVKIERAPALVESDSMLAASHGMMVARGDLALDINIEKVPMAQKRLVSEANRKGKPVITATQMLESMVRNPGPTRAEATDVANAVLDGSDALMLSEETAIGKYPVEAIVMMSKIIMEAQAAFPFGDVLKDSRHDTLPEINDATAKASCLIAHQIDAKAIVVFTSGGTTAQRVSKYRPHQPIIALTPFETTRRRLSLLWGVVPVTKVDAADIDQIFEHAEEAALESGAAVKGDLIVITAGLPLSVSGSTNLVKVHKV